jgi:pentatricopeptide repeat protein
MNSTNKLSHNQPKIESSYFISQEHLDDIANKYNYKNKATDDPQIDESKLIRQITHRIQNCKDDSEITQLVKNYINQVNKDTSIHQLLTLAHKYNKCDTYMINCALTRLCELGHTKKAQEIFGEIQQFGCNRDITTYNIILNHFKPNQNKFNKYLDLLSQEELSYDNYTYSTLMKFHLINMRFETCITLFNQAQHQDITVDLVIINNLLEAK